MSHLGASGVYNLPIESYDKDDPDRSTITNLEIPFEVNRLPPVFTTENTVFIENPEFQGDATILQLKAEDGDTDINAEIQYEILGPITNCNGCFMVGSTSGSISWVKEIPKPTILLRNVTFTVTATEIGIPNGKSTEENVVITFPGDELNPEFTKPEYIADLERVFLTLYSTFRAKIQRKRLKINFQCMTVKSARNFLAEEVF